VGGATLTAAITVAERPPQPPPNRTNRHPPPSKRTRLLLEGADISDAVAATRLHDQLLPLPTKTFVENGTWAPTPELPPEVVASLEARGQDLEGLKFGLGVAQAIFVRYPKGGAGGKLGFVSKGAAGGERGVLVGMSDARKDGAPFAAE
jgi:hypothetical protein